MSRDDQVRKFREEATDSAVAEDLEEEANCAVVEGWEEEAGCAVVEGSTAEVSPTAVLREMNSGSERSESLAGGACVAVSFGEALRWGTTRLKSLGILDASVDAWLLLEYVTGISRAIFLADRGRRMTEQDLKTYRELIEARGTHIPLQHLTGVQEFMGFPFHVNSHVLVPRQDTEILVCEARKRLHRGMRLLDLCTGSGCIAISLEKSCPGITVDGADLSEEALEVAKRNGESLESGVNWIHSDLFSCVEGTYDMIVSNPPYIRTAVIDELAEEVRLHEPRMALDGKEDGLYFYRRILKGSRSHLKAGGWLLFEIGYDQGEAVSSLMRSAGYEYVELVQDLAGLNRLVLGHRK